MLTLVHEIVDEMKFIKGQEFWKGKEYFNKAFGEFERQYLELHKSIAQNIQKKQDKILSFSLNPELDDDSKNDLRELQNHVIRVYQSFLEGQSSNLGHYFRFLYNVVKFVESANLNDQEKKRYINLVQAQMSDFELGLLFYNALSEKGAKWFPLIEKYNILENINKSAVIVPGVHRRFYPNSTFKYLA